MAGIRPIRTELQEPPALQDRAMDNLQFIRETMERAGSFTAVSGWAEVAIGLTALGTAAVATRQPTLGRWLAVWFTQAMLSFVIAGYAMVRKARAAGVPMLAGPGRKFVMSFLPPMLAGVVITVLFVAIGLASFLPGVWMLVYGAAVIAAGAFSVRIVPVMGAAFMVVGTLALAAAAAPAVAAARGLSPYVFRDLLMAVGFGGLHVVFGTLIARRHGG